MTKSQPKQETEKKPAHSPTPWKDSERSAYRILDAEGNPVADFTNLDDRDFAMAVINSHEPNERKIAALVEAARTMLNVVEGLKMRNPDRLQFRLLEAHESMLRAALSLAQEGK